MRKVKKINSSIWTESQKEIYSTAEFTGQKMIKLTRAHRNSAERKENSAWTELFFFFTVQTRRKLGGKKKEDHTLTSLDANLGGKSYSRRRSEWDRDFFFFVGGCSSSSPPPATARRSRSRARSRACSRLSLLSSPSR